MSAQHSAGPWSFGLSHGGNGGGWLVSADGEMVITYTTDDDGLHGKPADLALVAAAPDLLKALEWINRERHMIPHIMECIGYHALAKARGEA